MSDSGDSKPPTPIRQQLWAYRANLVAILTPIVLMPIPILYTSQASKCAYAILVMAVYWMTEVVPMAVTALLPVVFMPWFGIMDSRDVCEHYLKDANMLFFGGLMIAIAVEKWNLHKRVALRVLMLVGSRPPWIMFGFMSVTAFLSMWLSNTATTAMMVPIAHAVLRELGEHRRRQLERLIPRDHHANPSNEQIQMEIKITPENNHHHHHHPHTHSRSDDHNINFRSLFVPHDPIPKNESSVTLDALDVPLGFSKNESSVTLDGLDTPFGFPKNDTCITLLDEVSPAPGLACSNPDVVCSGGKTVIGIPKDESTNTLVDVASVDDAKRDGSMLDVSASAMPKNESSQLLLAENQRKRRRYISAGGNSIKEVTSAIDHDRLSLEDDAVKDRQFKNFSKALKLSIAYAANIGGTATLTGTGPNIVLKGQADAIYHGDAGINFSSWFVLALPNMILALFLAWLWLLLLFLGPREAFLRREENEKNSSAETATQVIKREYRKLGQISFAEATVLCHFIVLALLWLTKEPEFVPGWGSLMPNKYVTDSSVAITVSAFLFLLPSRLPECLRSKRANSNDDESSSSSSSSSKKNSSSLALLDWQTVNKKMPWGVIILLGGGFALADACKISGLSVIVGDMLGNFRYLPGWAIVLVLCLLTVALTGFTSNVATATIFMPILAELAETVNIHPLYLMIPVTISASFAFILPVSTPPNAIVFAYGDIKILDMLRAGLPMSIICVLVLQIAINTWGYVYFDLGQFPEWAYIRNTHLLGANVTLVATTAAGLNATLFTDALSQITAI